MANKGNQATFILPPEPQADNRASYTFIRKKGALSVEKVSARYDLKHKAFAVHYRPSAEGLAHQISKADNLTQLTRRLRSIGFTLI